MHGPFETNRKAFPDRKGNVDGVERVVRSGRIGRWLKGDTEGCCGEVRIPSAVPGDTGEEGSVGIPSKGTKKFRGCRGQRAVGGGGNPNGGKEPAGFPGVFSPMESTRDPVRHPSERHKRPIE
eukprot:scaffold684_cov345-Pavlova_lutheri.AAC.49